MARRSPFRRSALARQVRILTLAVVGVVAAACGGSTAASSDPQTAIATDGRFEVRLTVDRATLTPATDITGQAELWLKAGTSGTVWGPSDLIGFEFVEAGGQNRAVSPAFDQVCAPHQVGSDQPLSMPITKSGGASDGDPNADFVRAFLQGQEIRLPPGEWDISAVASFFEGRGCGGLRHDVRATVRVKVNP